MMRLKIASLCIGFLLLAGGLSAQQNAATEIEIHNHVKLIEMAVPLDIPQEFREKYQAFLPLFVAALKENTTEQTADKAITFRIVPGIKEVGSAKTKRIFAKITAYRTRAKAEFVGNLLLHSYATGETVSMEEIKGFLLKQILGPLGKV
jgi:hypothetical protein